MGGQVFQDESNQTLSLSSVRQNLVQFGYYDANCVGVELSDLGVFLLFGQRINEVILSARIIEITREDLAFMLEYHKGILSRMDEDLSDISIPKKLELSDLKGVDVIYRRACVAQTYSTKHIAEMIWFWVDCYILAQMDEPPSEDEGLSSEDEVGERFQTHPVLNVRTEAVLIRSLLKQAAEVGAAF